MKIPKKVHMIFTLSSIRELLRGIQGVILETTVDNILFSNIPYVDSYEK